MNKRIKKLLTIAAAIVTISGCVYAGRTEYNDAVLSAMSAEKYRYIRDGLGSHASAGDVVKEYVANQKYYDSITY